MAKLIQILSVKEGIELLNKRRIEFGKVSNKVLARKNRAMASAPKIRYELFRQHTCCNNCGIAADHFEITKYKDGGYSYNFICLKLNKFNMIKKYILTIDHIIPLSRGGKDHISNMQILCSECNSLKESFLPEELDMMKDMSSKDEREFKQTIRMRLEAKNITNQKGNKKYHEGYCCSTCGCFYGMEEIEPILDGDALIRCDVVSGRKKQHHQHGTAEICCQV